MFFVSCVTHAFVSLHCCHMVACWERADLMAHFGDVYCIFVTVPYCILGQVWYLIVLFHDLCCLLTLLVYMVCVYRLSVLLNQLCTTACT